MIKTVTLTADTPQKITFEGAYPYYWIDNKTAGNVYASVGGTPEADADGTYTVAAGSQMRISGGVGNNGITLLGDGKVQIIASSIASCPFKSAQKGGGDESGSASTALTNAKSYTDTAIADLINGAPTTLDTLGEIATAMAENADVVKALNEAVGTKANMSDLTAHAGNKSNPHGVTKSQIGLENVGNFKAVSVIADQGLTDSEKANARSNIGAGNSSFSGSYSDLENKPTLATVATSGNYDDLTNKPIIPSAYTHPNSGVMEGTYKSVTVNAQGHVTGGTNPTTLAGYGITDAAAKSHTHNYAGSSSAGGAATSANKLNSDAGSATQPVYFKDGVPVKTTYTLGKSVPSDAKFTDPHYVSKNVVGSSTATSNTTSALTNGNVYLNSVENGAVTSAHKISGSGATNVTTDASGNIIISSTDTRYTHPTTSGNKHIPSGGSSGQILRWSADGTAVWGDESSGIEAVVQGDIPSGNGAYQMPYYVQSGTMTVGKSALEGIDITFPRAFTAAPLVIFGTAVNPSYAKYPAIASYNNLTNKGFTLIALRAGGSGANAIPDAAPCVVNWVALGQLEV